MKLNTEKWEEFKLKDLFEIKMGNKFDKNKMSMDNPTVNFVTRIGYNNGVDEKVDLVDGVEPYQAGLMTVSLGGSLGESFVQYEPFYTAQNVAVLSPRKKDMSRACMMFVSALIKYESKVKYYAFGRELNSHINRDFSLMLPVKRNVKGMAIIDKKREYSSLGLIPDWDYMDSYIHSLNFKPISTRNVYLKETFCTSSWKCFKLSDIFDIYNGKGITQEEIFDHEGNLNVVQSGEGNNGVLGKIDLDYCIEKKYTYCLGKCLTVARSGSAGYVSFQNFGCVVGDSAKILRLKYSRASSAMYLFMQAILSLNRFKYAYGRKVTEENYKEIVLQLPVLHNVDGTIHVDKDHKYSEEGFIPDWEFMDKYIVSLPYGDRIL